MKMQFAAWAAEQSIAFNAFDGDRFKMILDKLPGRGSHGINFRKHQVEIYVSIKERIVDAIARARRSYSIPFISVNVDLFTSKTQNKKYVAVRLSYIDGGHQYSWNIAVREFNPSTSERKAARASELVVAWVRDICIEFGVEMQRDILTSSSDSGSDIKRALEAVFPTMREWCISHLIHLALVDAFGTNIDRSKCKNVPAQEIFDCVRSTTEKVNKSGNLKTLFDELTLAEFGAYRKLKNAPAHRWSSSELVLEQLLLLWSVLVAAFAESGHAFAIGNDRVVLTEFYSVLWACRYVQVQAQKMHEYVATAVYINLAALWFGLLDPKKTLDVIDPTTGAESTTEAAKLDPRTTTVRALLRGAMATRYYDRYHPLRALKNPTAFYGNRSQLRGPAEVEAEDLRFSYVLDMQAALCSQMSDGALVRELINKSDLVDEDCPLGWTPGRLKEAHFHLTMAFLWKTITRLAVRVAFHRGRSSADEAPSNLIEGPVRGTKRRRSDTFSLLNDLLGRHPVSNSPAAPKASSDPAAVVEAEIRHYRALKLSGAQSQKPEQQIAWWSLPENQIHMPCLGGGCRCTPRNEAVFWWIGVRPWCHGRHSASEAVVPRVGVHRNRHDDPAEQTPHTS